MSSDATGLVPESDNSVGPEPAPRWGLTRREFQAVCGVPKGDHELARNVDAFWRATEPSHKLVPLAAFVTGGLFLCIPLLRSVQIGSDSAANWTHIFGVILTVYGGMILLARTVLADFDRASERYIEARITLPGPVPAEWLPPDATIQNYACRVAVAGPEREMIRTGQLSAQQLGQDPIAYIHAVERAANGRTKFTVLVQAGLERFAGGPRDPS
ncbi:MAG: hypothetical protein ACRDKE_03905 [Solirubrobacterales bacterium]